MMKLVNVGMSMIVAVAVSVGANSASAGPLAFEHVPAEADWLVHVDIEQSRTTQAGALVDEKLDKEPKVAAGRAYAEAAFGVNLRDDLLGITLYGRGTDPADAAMLIYVAADLDKFLAFVGDREHADLQLVNHGDHTIYSALVARKNERRYMAIVNRDLDNLVIVSSALATVQQALDVADAKSASALEGNLGGIAALSPGACFQLIATDLASLVEGKPRSALFQHIRQTAIQSGESDGQAFLTVTVAADDDTIAGNMAQALKGLLAMGRLRAQRHEMKDLDELLQAVTVEQLQSVIDVEIRLSADAFAGMLERHLARR